MIRVLVALAVALVVGCTGSGPPACDQAALAAITETLEREAESPGAETRALAGLAEACPRLHPGLVHALRSVHVVERLESLAVFNGLPEARERVCADPGGWVRDVPTAPADRRPRIIFERCGFARLGVLDAGERLLADDTDVLFMVATLERDGVDKALLRRLGRALMISVAPLPVAERRCAAMPDDRACERLLAVAGVEPAPVSGEREGLRERPQLLLSRSALRWDGEASAALEDGALRAEHVAGHRIIALAVDVAAWLAGSGAREHERRVVLAPDRGLAFGVVVDSLYTLASSGVVELALVGRDDYHLVVIPVSTPEAWSPARRDSYDSVGPVVTIDESVVSVSPRPGEVTKLPAGASAAITAFAARVRAASPYNYGIVNVRATRTTRVDTVIAVLDALRGPECPRASVTDKCLLSRPIIDQEPPLE